MTKEPLRRFLCRGIYPVKPVSVGTGRRALIFGVVDLCLMAAALDVFGQFLPRVGRLAPHHAGIALDERLAILNPKRARCRNTRHHPVRPLCRRFCPARSRGCGTASALPKCSIMSGCGTRIVLRGKSPSHSATTAPASVRCIRHWRRSPLQHKVLSALLA